MKIHEYQSRDILKQFNIPSSAGQVVFRAEDAAAVFTALANPTCMAKVQVLMGGRGKAGGVQRMKTADEARLFCQKFLGQPFSTYQSPEPKIVRAVLLTEDLPITKEYYLSITVDRSHGGPVILFSKEGGVEIEEVAQKNPDAIKKIYFSPNLLPNKELILSVLKKEFPDQPNVASQIAEVAANLARLFIEKDASIAEINPLVLSAGDKVLALDAKLVIDDNALFRHEDLQKLKDPDEEDEREKKAKKFGLSYVSMTGNVGCLVNGAGLAMATMDMIKFAGGEPANFLDVGGGATADQVREAFKIILEDERVETILVNIFGGIMKCDVIAEGVIQASKEAQLQVPLVVRLEGTRVEEGRALLKNSGLKIISCTTIREAAETAVREAKKYRESHVHSNR